MPYPIEDKLVIAVSSKTLFDLEFEDQLFKDDGLAAYIDYQKKHQTDIPKPGAAFTFVKNILNLNSKFPEESPVEVVLLTRQHASAGLRTMNAIEHYGLDISRAFFLAGNLPFPFMASVHASLYLSTNAQEVKDATDMGYPAGFVLPTAKAYKEDKEQLVIAFDFDGVIADDQAEKVYDKEGMEIYHEHEHENRKTPLGKGPLFSFLKKISNLQKLEQTHNTDKNIINQLIRIAIVTARNAPAHARLIHTLDKYNIDVPEMYFTGGINKKNILDVLKPQIYFDDQIHHLESAVSNTPCVHIPFGITNIDLTE